MLKYVVRRLLLLIPILLAVYTITFVLMKATPGGPWEREKPLPAEVVANLNKKYHLDDPVWKQYIDYVGGVVTRFDFGPSYKSTSRDVSDIIVEQFPVSITIGIVAMILGLVFGVTLGIISALKQNTIFDYLAMFFAIGGVSVPVFVVGPILVLIFALNLGLFPTGGWTTQARFLIFDIPKLDQLILPALALSLEPAAQLARYTRSSMLEVIRMDYVRTARAKGLAELFVVVRHALRNSLIPVATVAGYLLAVVITGSFYVETIFRIQGLGRYFVSSVSNRDYPVLLGVTLLFALVIALVNLFVDLMYGWLDPRIRYS